MPKTKEHEHNLYPTEVFKTIDYEWMIIVIKCSEEDCDYEDWDYGKKIELA